MMDRNIPGRILGLVLRSFLLPSVVPNKPKSLRAPIALRYVACRVGVAELFVQLGIQPHLAIVLSSGTTTPLPGCITRGAALYIARLQDLE